MTYLRVWLIVLALAHPALVLSAGETSKSLSEQDKQRDACDAILASWVLSVRPAFRSDSLTLDVDLSSLYDVLKIRKCYSYDQLWLELWWVTEVSQSPRPDNFGSTSYFSKFERCHQLEPEHFVFHSSKQLDTNFDDEGVDGEKPKVAKFYHIVEHEYILRICPCGRRQSGVNMCDCKYSTTEKPHCGKIISVDAGHDAVVYPWCRSSSKQDISDNVTTKIVVHSPVVNCTSVLFTGVMASCTPLQSYDRVRLSLHLVQPEVVAGFECNKHQHFGSNNPVVIETSIHNINGSHGDFSVYLSVLAPQSVYCLQIELVDHPYCNSHLTIGHGLGPVPRVCASHMAQPVITPKCTDSHRGQVVKRAGNSYYFIGILAVGLAAVIGVGVICVICTVVKMRKRSAASGKGPRGKEVYLPRHVSGYSCHSLDAVPGFGFHETAIDRNLQEVFLLRLPHSTFSDDVHLMFFDWLESIGCHVHDMSNPDEDEAINLDPEGWVQSILSKPNVKVVVVEGDPADIVDKDFSARPSPASLEPRVVTPASPGTTSSSLTESVPSSIDGRVSKSHEDGMFEDTDPLLDDPRYELRIFAWKFIQNNFVGKYNQIILVRFCHGGGRPPNHESSALSLTPFRQSFLVPHHLHEIRKWLRQTTKKSPKFSPKFSSKFSSGKSVSKMAAEKEVELCATRLRSALVGSQYDCI